MKKRKVFEFKNFSCIAAFWKGKYQGTARLSQKIPYATNLDTGLWEKPPNEEVFRVIGIDLQDVENKLKEQIEQNGQKIFYDHLKKAHQAVLRSNNVENYREIGITLSANKNHRTAHCFRCKNKLDNHYNHECDACEWILCVCGACGCSYSYMKY